MVKEIITGILEYCYGGIPIVRWYCSYKTLIKHSKAHEAYQRTAEDKHVEEIKDFISKASYKFMPEIVLSYDYKGIFPSIRFKELLKENAYLNPIQYLMDSQKSVSLNDIENYISLKRVSCSTKGFKIIQFEFEEPHLNEIIFNRLDGNHRLQALESIEGNDFQIPFCIILLNGNNNPELNEREKTEMEIFHNINSKAKPLTPIEQYRGLFKLFSVAELAVYGKEFSLTKAYLTKHRELRFSNISNYITNSQDIILYCIKFLLDRGFTISEDDIADVLSKLEHTYFSDYETIRNCKSKLAIVPYVYYCYEGGKQKNAKLSAYNTWFIKNKLYNVKDLDPSSIIDVFNSIFDIRKKQVFVAMPFKPELDFVFDAICETVSKINRENGTDLLKPIRIDKQIVGFSYDIVNEILENIKNAGLLIADLTDQNANVYYEVGYAQGLIKAKLGNTAEVLYLISNPEKPDEPFSTAKFDVQHYKMIPYKNVGNGVNELKLNLEKELKNFYCI